MKIFISKDSKKIIKKNYKIINKEVAIIDVENIAKIFYVDNYTTDVYSKFILNYEITKMFKYSYLSKRCKNVLYIVKDINLDLLSNLKIFLDANNIYFTEFILIDFSMSIDSKLYSEFDNII